VVDSARLSGFDGLLKASVDFGLGTLFLILSLPVSLCIILILTLRRSKPLFITQEFLSIGGRTFRAQTFCHNPQGPLGITGLYRLPLLWSVMLGQMSLVGPRPILADERNHYRRWLPSLASVKPGVTGPWAVVPVAALEEEMRAALYYIRNWTIWLDLQVLTQTALVILRRRWGKLE
jgi:lipopolysaccharide/colanic/teichoic acid biosynthesis glycosyltransferase